MKNSSDHKTDELFKEVGEFGKYQLLVFVLVGITAFIPAFVGYSYSFYAAVPNHRFLFIDSSSYLLCYSLSIFLLFVSNRRCQLPLLANDSYEIFNDQHDLLVQKHIPKPALIHKEIASRIGHVFVHVIQTAVLTRNAIVA